MSGPLQTIASHARNVEFVEARRAIIADSTPCARELCFASVGNRSHSNHSVFNAPARRQ
jgi:hypothetical protein